MAYQMPADYNGPTTHVRRTDDVERALCGIAKHSWRAVHFARRPSDVTCQRCDKAQTVALLAALSLLRTRPPFASLPRSMRDVLVMLNDSDGIASIYPSKANGNTLRGLSTRGLVRRAEGYDSTFGWMLTGAGWRQLHGGRPQEPAPRRTLAAHDHHSLAPVRSTQARRAAVPVDCPSTGRQVRHPLAGASRRPAGSAGSALRTPTHAGS